MESSPNQLPLPRKRKWAWTCGVLAAVGFIFIACGSDRPDGSSAAPPIDPSQGCSTPNEGCPCQTVGEIAQCGTVKHTGPDGYVTCSMGTRTCNGQSWGACFGEHDVRTKVLPPGQLHTSALGPSTQCPPGWNACDPYCMLFDDNLTGVPVDGGGGVAVVDGGLTIDPNAGSDGGADASAPSVFTSTPGGVSDCSPNRNVVGPACTPATALTTCQQDHRCDPTTNQCLWNGGPGYSDPSAGGFDLTVGAPCGPQGSATSTAPVCNRGTAPVPAGTTITFHTTNGPSPPNGCTNLGAPTFTRTLGAALPPGGCTSFALANSPGAKFITINAGPSGMQPAAEAAGRCANNSAYWRTDGSAGDCALCSNTCNTRLTGTIRDPRGVNPLPDVFVYVPGTAVTPVPDPPPVACDSCTNLVSGNPLYQTTTAVDGTFTIDVPAGGSFPLVIQTGRWRRVVTVPAVPKCTTGTLSAALARLPKNKAEGTIPKMALTMSQGDHLQCLLRKIGIDDAEFTAAGGTGRVHLYTHNGMTFAGATNGPTNLWDNAANLSTYSAVIAPCDNNHTTYPAPVLPGPNTTNPPNPTASAAGRANMKAYLDGGGRLFTTHWMSHDFVHLNWPAPAGPVGPEFGANVDADREPNAFPYTIDTSTPAGNTLSLWGQVVGAVSAGPPPTITFGSWRHLSKTVNTAGGATRLSYGDSTQPPISHPQNAAQWGGPHVNMYQFETPWGVAGTKCGRVVVSQSHVSSGAGAFPGGCGLATTAMTAQEKAFEYLFFSSQACLGPPPPPPVPPPPPPLPSVVFSRDYFGSCPVGHRAVWQPFYWQSIIPAGTSIQIYAGTADTQAGLPASQTAPGVKSVGLADTTVVNPSWDCDGCPGAPVSVDYHLRNDPPPPNSVSKPWLRVFMLLTPNNAVSPPAAPTLTSWRQVYSCVPVE